MTRLPLTLLRYGSAVVAVALVMGIKEITDSLFGGGPPLILFLSTVMVIARYSGTGPALVAIALSALVCNYFYFPPFGTLRIHSLNDGFRLGVFLLEGAVLCALMGSFRAAKSQAEQSMRHALSQEEALRESEQRFRLLIESVKDYAIIMLDPDGRVVTWNAGAERTKGYRADEILGEHFSRFYPPEDLRAGKPENELWVASDSGRSEDLGWRVRKDGSSFWANVVITAMRDGSGHLRGFSKVTRDITERKQAEDVLEGRVVERTAQLNRVNEQLRSELDERRRVENELKASEKRFRSLSASSPIGIFQTDAEGLYIYANERCLSIIGIASGENLGHGWAKTLHPDDREAVFAEWMSAALAARDFSREYRILTSEGEVRWVHARAAVVPADGSDLGGHVGTLEDITGRKRAEEELRTSEERFKILTRATNDAIWDWDLTTNGIWINECVESLFGYPADEVGTDRTWWSDRVHSEDWVWVEPSIQAVLDGDGSFWSGEYRFRHQDGSYSAVFDRGYVIRDGARSPVRMIGSMMDISERKRVLAETLNARQAAEAANRAKSEFLANMSHEIRTPMNGVLGMLDLALRSDIAAAPARVTSAWRRSSAETLLRLLNDILDFSKIEAGKLELESTPFSLRETLGDTHEDPGRCRCTRRGWSWPTRSPPTCPTPWWATRGA